jgi:hypothetical protein
VATVEAPQNVTVLIDGSPVLVMTDVFVIKGCTFNISGSPAPCLNVLWTTPSLSVRVNGQPALLASSAGACLGGSGSVPAVVKPGQTTILAD